MYKYQTLFGDVICDTGMPHYAVKHISKPRQSKSEYGRRKEMALAEVCAYDLACASTAMPSIRPYVTAAIPQSIVPYNVWRSGNTKDGCVHFYVHDYHFVGLLDATESRLAELKAAS